MDSARVIRIFWGLAFLVCLGKILLTKVGDPSMSRPKKNVHKEVIVFLCPEHELYDLSVSYPDFKFNCLPCYASSPCNIDGCLNLSYYRFIGITIPDTCPDLRLKSPKLASDEIYFEATKALTGSNALEKLTSFLYFKTRTFVYDDGDLAAVLVIKQLARLLLKDMKIEENKQMNTRQISRVLAYLKIYPADYLETNEKAEEE